jgi:hypothetical protein
MRNFLRAPCEGIGSEADCGREIGKYDLLMEVAFFKGAWLNQKVER